MTITTYSTLVDNVYKWLIRDQATDTFITADLVQTYIQLCEAEMNRELKIIDTESTQTYTLSTSNDYITLPTGYRGITAFEFTSRPYDIQYFPTRRAMKDAFASDTGRPKAYTIIGQKAIFNCTPDSAYTMTMDFYKNITALTATATTNTILTKFPDVYLYGSIRQALINLNDQRRLEAIAPVYQNILARILEDDKNGRLPVGAAMKPRNAIG
jgi:hypothetical protein